MSNYVVPSVVVLLIFVIVVCSYWSLHRRRAESNSQTRVRAQAPGAQSPSNSEESDNGLDQETIDSYPTVVVGESGRMAKPEDNTCHICLSEYVANDRLRMLPECVHRFHASCLDTWLRVKATCPVCRVDPSSTHSTTHGCDDEDSSIAIVILS